MICYKNALERFLLHCSLSIRWTESSRWSPPCVVSSFLLQLTKTTGDHVGVWIFYQSFVKCLSHVLMVYLPQLSHWGVTVLMLLSCSNHQYMWKLLPHQHKHSALSELSGACSLLTWALPAHTTFSFHIILVTLEQRLNISILSLCPSLSPECSSAKSEFVCVFMGTCLCALKTKGHVSGFPLVLSFFVYETELLTEPGAHWFRLLLVSLSDPPVTASLLP